MRAINKRKGAGLYDYWRWLWAVGESPACRLWSLAFLVWPSFRFLFRKEKMDSLGLLTSHFCYRVLGRLTILRYQDKILDLDEQKIADEALAMVRRGIRTANMIPFTAFWNSFVNGFIQVFVISEEEYDEVDLCNLYTPHYIYLTFSSRTNLILIIGFIITTLMSIYCYGIASIQFQAYICLTLQLSIQLEFLNHSIRTLPERADRMYTQLFRKVPTGGRPYHLPEYQVCLYKCLRSNIQHHQALKKDDVFIYTGAVVLLLLVTAAMMLAMKLHLLLKVKSFEAVRVYSRRFPQRTVPHRNTIPSGYRRLGKTGSFTAKQAGRPVVSFINNYSQGATTGLQSSKLFASLYYLQWPECNKSFNKILNVFWVYTREPMIVKMFLFDMKAFIEFYGDLMIGAYKHSNLLKQSDSKQNL